MTRRRGLLYATGALTLIVPPAFWLASGLGSLPSSPPPRAAVGQAPVELAAAARAALVELAQRDPMALVRIGHERYHQTIRGYRCLFIKQERLGRKLSEVQEIEVRYREEPQSIYMLWRKNPDGARRALFIDSPEFLDEQGRRLARIEPNGAVARLFVKDIKLPVDGPDARKASRRTIDEFGFLSTIELLLRYNAIAAERGVLDLRYDGTGVIDGRPTFRLVRDLPYEGPEGPYPDARMVLHLDQEWLLPVAVYSYADHAERELLGSYVYTQVELNPTFAPDAFRF